jgi:hypothetical protein
MGEITKRWESYGLLDGLTDVEKTMLALNMERTTLHIIDDTTNKYDKIGVMIFPVLRKISDLYFSNYRLRLERQEYNTLEDAIVTYQYYNINPMDVLEHLTIFMNSRETQDLIDDLKVHPQIDWEAELCALYSENFCRTFRNKIEKLDPIKYLKKHKL